MAALPIGSLTEVNVALRRLALERSDSESAQKNLFARQIVVAGGEYHPSVSER
jgi:hypothetical protein